MPSPDPGDVFSVDIQWELIPRFVKRLGERFKDTPHARALQLILQEYQQCARPASGVLTIMIPLAPLVNSTYYELKVLSSKGTDEKDAEA